MAVADDVVVHVDGDQVVDVEGAAENTDSRQHIDSNIAVNTVASRRCIQIAAPQLPQQLLRLDFHWHWTPSWPMLMRVNYL